MSLQGIPPPADPIESKQHQDDKFTDLEDNFIKPEITQYDDPFGNEANAEVKYKTLKWWYVPRYLLTPVRMLI